VSERPVSERPRPEVLGPDVLVRYYAAARAAAGVTQESAHAGTVSTLRAELVTRHGPRFATVWDACSLLIDGLAVTANDRELTAGAVVEVLPPFAGG
jgi:sulfur-carrier protein